MIQHIYIYIYIHMSDLLAAREQRRAAVEEARLGGCQSAGW